MLFLKDSWHVDKREIGRNKDISRIFKYWKKMYPSKPMPAYGGDLERILSLIPLHESTNKTSHDAPTVLSDLEELKDVGVIETNVQHRIAIKIKYVPLTALGNMRSVLVVTQNALSGKYCLLLLHKPWSDCR